MKRLIGEINNKLTVERVRYLTMKRTKDGPVTKKLKRTFESPGGHVRGNDSGDSEIWHSTAISNSRNSPGPFREAGSEIMGSQRSTTSLNTSNIRAVSPVIEARARSPVIITESSGHVHFSAVLQKHGFFLSPEGNATQHDSMVFRKLMTDWVEKSSKGSAAELEALQNFTGDMKRYLGVKENLLNAMSPTEHKKELYQPSLLHSLLGVLPLQKPLFTVLFPSLAETSYTVQDDEEVAFLVQLLNQFKWLPYLNEAEKITDDLLEIFERATPKAQYEMMRLLPDIVPEVNHSKIGDKLLKLLEEFSPMCSSIMDCFSVINVPDKDIVNVRNTAIENMLVANQKDLPAYLGFLLGIEDPDLLSTVIGDMREKLIFRPPMESLEDAKANMKAMVYKIKFCVSINRHLVHLWVKQIKEEFVLEATEFKTLDLLMLLVFIDSADRAAEAPLRNLFNNEDLTLHVLQEFIENFPGVVDLVFDGLLKFCEKFFWTIATKFYRVASKVLVKLFNVVTDLHARGIIQLFTCTLAHGNKLCREYIIDALTQISQIDCARLLRFTNLVMAIMDFVIEFEPSEIRNVIRILATVAYIPKNRESERFETEFSILLRKQLSQRNEKIKSIGVIGAVAAIDQLAKQENIETTKLRELVDLVWNIVERDGNSCWIFFDEMAAVVSERDLPNDVLAPIKKILGTKFQERWTVVDSSVDGLMNQDENLKICQVLNANESMDVESLSIRFDSEPIGLNPFVLAAHVKFLCASEYKVADGSLEEVDIIVGCPLLLPDLDYYRDIETVLCCSSERKNLLGHYLVYAINLIRELVSAFCSQKDSASKIKVFLRLNHLVELQKLLISLVMNWENNFPSLPFAYALEKNTSAVSAFQATKKRKKNQDKKNTKKFGPTPIFEDSSDSDTGGGVTKVASLPKKNVPKILGEKDLKDYVDELQPTSIRPFLRRFHRNVFRLLRYRLVVNPPDVDHIALLNALQTEENSCRNEVKQVIVLTPETLVLVLRDLNEQVESDKNKLCIVGDVASIFSKDFLKCICDHLDVLTTSCEADFSSWTIAKKRQVESCFRLLYNTLKNYLERTCGREHQEKFQQAMKIISEHAEGSSEDQSVDGIVAKYLKGNPEFINSPATAVQQLKVLKIVHDNAANKNCISSIIAEICMVYLKRRWKLPSTQIPFLLKTWLVTSDNPLEVMLMLTKDLIPEDPGKIIPDCSEYKSCTSANFHTWYRSIMEALCQHVVKNMKKVKDLDISYVEWNDAIEILKFLVAVIQQKRQAKIITPLLKNSKFFLDSFTIYGVKLLPLLWNTDANQARSFLKHLQAPTRKIQYICEHCKVEKNTALIRYVPTVKRSLESLVFRVREILAVHGAPNAFWMGSLKHRNLDGEEINSQITDISDDEEDESDEDETTANNDNLFELSDEGSVDDN
ncbi:unnamed protein product [Allacma fusca]|uniref:Fanconi anemia group D2 protein n=1 Tax=Allacma fusca TaxID=39272 RepID=A0A8J2P348_9HEXA|nr:unnamed protein product [Allacma fusca]